MRLNLNIYDVYEIHQHEITKNSNSPFSDFQQHFTKYMPDEKTIVNYKSYVIAIEILKTDSQEKYVKTKDKIITSFLILGTILALFLAYYGWNDMYRLWNYPERAFMYSTELIILYIDFTLLGLAGIVSIFSYIRKGCVWVTTVKCIIVNIVLLLILPLYFSVVLLIYKFFLGLLMMIVIAACLFGLWKLWKLIDSYTG